MIKLTQPTWLQGTNQSDPLINRTSSQPGFTPKSCPKMFLQSDRSLDGSVTDDVIEVNEEMTSNLPKPSSSHPAVKNLIENTNRTLIAASAAIQLAIFHHYLPNWVFYVPRKTSVGCSKKFLFSSFFKSSGHTLPLPCNLAVLLGDWQTSHLVLLHLNPIVSTELKPERVVWGWEIKFWEKEQGPFVFVACLEYRSGPMFIFTDWFVKHWVMFTSSRHASCVSGVDELFLRQFATSLAKFFFFQHLNVLCLGNHEQ